MIRPQRAFIMLRTTPLHRRIVLVRLTSSTDDHSSSDIRMNRLSFVIPALFTRISTDPIASAACLGRAVTAAASDRLQGSTNARDPSAAASACSGSTRVPDKATVAPAPCNTVAIAAPMPPDAPVTSAFFPVRSNICIPFFI